jgi:hypothetical protein
MKTIVATFLTVLLLLPVSALGEIQTSTHTIKQPSGGGQSADDAGTPAIAKAKREALDNAEVPDMTNADEQPIQQASNTPWYLIFGAYFTGTVAILLYFSNALSKRLRRPIIKPDFDMNDSRCFHKIVFDMMFRLKDPITKIEHVLKQPGYNSRAIIHNKGRTTAQNVLVRIEKIILKCGQDIVTYYYHPTSVKWSGEKEYNKIDIAPHSYFLLDLIGIVSETKAGLIELYPAIEDLIKRIKDERFSGRTYWDVWVDKSYDRGIPNYYMEDGDYELKYIITGDNCAAVTFRVNFQWKRAEWNKPRITLLQEEKMSCRVL